MTGKEVLKALSEKTKEIQKLLTECIHLIITGKSLFRLHIYMVLAGGIEPPALDLKFQALTSGASYIACCSQIINLFIGRFLFCGCPHHLGNLSGFDFLDQFETNLVPT